MAGSTPMGVKRTVLQDGSRFGVLPASNIPRIQFSTGSARALQSLSRDLFNASARIEDRLDQQAVAEGKVEGATAGATGEFEPKDYTTLRNRAYNEAGIQTFVATMETRSIAAMAEIQRKFANDPVGMKAAMDQYNAGVAQQIDQVSPGAGAMYRRSALTRTLPAVEGARDSLFRMTKDQAEAALIESQVALDAELKSHAAHLFSENPAQSQAAAAAVGQVGSNLMRVYNATDANGRPLFSPQDKARARAEFQERVMSAATLSWFDAQDDKADAYLRFISGDLDFEVDILPPDVPMVDGTFGKIRSQPISNDVREKLATAVSATDPELGVMVVSGGQDAAGSGGRRTGSTRHDHGGAGDIVLLRNGRPVTPEDDPELYERFLENAAAAGFSGIGHYPWGVHVGGGKRAAWGPDTRTASLDPRFGDAIARGWANPLDPSARRHSVNMRDAMTPGAAKALEAEMRARISFSNTLADREERIEEKDLQNRQALEAFDLSNRLYNAGQQDAEGNVIPELTRLDVVAAVEAQNISPAVGEAMIKALAVEAPEVSDRGTYDEAMRRMYADKQDIRTFIFENSDKLSKADAASLLAKNQSMNVIGAGTLSKNDQFQFDRLEDLLTPDSTMAQIDPGAEARKFAALDEFRQRVAEGEDSREVSADLAERAARDFDSITQSELDKLVLPRFAVVSEDGKLSASETVNSLIAARERGAISEASFERQKKLVLQWVKIMKRQQ